MFGFVGACGVVLSINKPHTKSASFCYENSGARELEGTMARSGLRTRQPPGVDPMAADEDGCRIPFVSIPRHTLILFARASAQYSLPRPPVTAISRMRAGPMVCATFWRSKLSTPRSLLHWFCIVAILRSHSFTQSGPWIITTQSASNTLPRRDLGF